MIELRASALVLSVTVDENPELARRFPSSTAPYFCAFTAGELIETDTGLTTVGEMEEAFADHLRPKRRR